MSDEERGQYLNKDLMKEVNPCGWQIFEKLLLLPDPGPCVIHVNKPPDTC